MGINTAVFQEPRGVMRVIQFIFAICAFAMTSGFSNTLSIKYCEKYEREGTINFGYPFELDKIEETFQACSNSTPSTAFKLVGDFSSDSQFFVATGVLSMLYTMGILVVYIMFDAVYQSNALVPMGDFLVTVLLAVFWLSGSAAWANGLDGLKSVTSNEVISEFTLCTTTLMTCFATTGSFSTLNISVILGFLNFFLWASDLWFLYKETQWFKNANPPTTSSAGISAA